MNFFKNQTIDDRRVLSETIGILRFPLMLGVVLAHVGIVGNSNNVFINIFGNYFLESFIRIPVPLYFFISGFLFFYGVDNMAVERKYTESNFIFWDKMMQFFCLMVILNGYIIYFGIHLIISCGLLEICSLLF